MSTKGERFKVGVQAAVEGFKELVNEHDLMKELYMEEYKKKM